MPALGKRFARQAIYAGENWIDGRLFEQAEAGGAVERPPPPNTALKQAESPENVASEDPIARLRTVDS